MRGTVLALACLVLLLLAQEGKGEGNTVKLCGRDFIRAVVFTCGGSRWKRHLTEHHDLGGEYQLKHPRLIPAHCTCIQGDPRGLGSNLQNTSKVSVLNKREAVKLLTTSCCNVGCSRREISSLC
uniref:Insulin like 5 n=1 Tax=Corvus moneduloides TaxID=1196302 RepID=A0A8C3DS58_CORMO